MEFLIRLTQAHESFRLPEIEALAEQEGIPISVLEYSLEAPYCIITAPSVEDAMRLVRRSILTHHVYEYWGSGNTLEELKASMVAKSQHLWDKYEECSFKIHIDSYQGKRSSASRMQTINFLSFLGFKGPVKMSGADQEFKLFEQWAFDAMVSGAEHPLRYHFGRQLGGASREIIKKYDLKKRRYINTTSMDSELALITANMALAAPGKLFYDPFVGTGSFPIACAEFGAITWGSDIDGRAARGEYNKLQGKGKSKAEMSLKGNFEQYGLLSGLGDMFTADLTNSPIRRHPIGAGGAGGRRRLFDGIICDPPYGVREGLRVLGCRDAEKRPWVVDAGKERYKEPDFVAPKKPYSFHAMLDDILAFAVETLVDRGRLSFWMPTANDQEQEITVPTHPCLEIVSVCTQPFNKWSRRLINYRRLPDDTVNEDDLAAWKVKAERRHEGVTADELNPFRKGYFKKFVTEEETKQQPQVDGK